MATHLDVQLAPRDPAAPAAAAEAETATVAGRAPSRPAVGWGIRLAWLGPVLALAGLIGFGTVPIEGGWFGGRRSDRVLAVWADYGDQLSNSVTQTSLKEIGLYVLLAVILLLAAVGYWLALTTGAGADDGAPDEPGA